MQSFMPYFNPSLVLLCWCDPEFNIHKRCLMIRKSQAWLNESKAFHFSTDNKSGATQHCAHSHVIFLNVCEVLGTLQAYFGH